MVAPYRYLAAITFTNAASASIRDGIHRATRPGPNVFVGTIHGFVNQFVVAPFARPFQLLPDERIFGGINLHEIVDDISSKRNKQFSPQQRNGVRKRIVTSLLKKGIIPYDEIINVACDLLERKEVRDRVCRRLQCLFVDEFQDIDPRHLKLFEHLRKAGMTTIYAVGDPEQFVYSFTYGQRGVPHPSFDKIPFFRFRDQCDNAQETINRRSCEEIVTFVNRFHFQLQQESQVGPRGEPRVLFFEDTTLPEIILRFRERSDQIPQQRGRYRRLYLGFENAAFDQVRTQFEILPLSNASRHQMTLLQDALELLALCIGGSQRKVVEAIPITLHEWRKWGLALLREIRDEKVTTAQEFLDQWLPKFQMIDLRERTTAVTEAFNHFRAAVLSGAGAMGNDWSSSIHRAKGLEATSVLVVATSLAELNKWLVTDHDMRKADKQDKCRLGFVAFSRAMELLCLASLEPLDVPTRNHLQSLGIDFVAENRTDH